MNDIDELRESFDRILEDLSGSGISAERKIEIIKSRNGRSNPINMSSTELQEYLNRISTKRLLIS